MSDGKPINYTREAFFHPVNLGLLFGATLTAFFLSDTAFSSFILSSSFGLELLFLGSIPRLNTFRKFINAKKASEVESSALIKSVFNVLTESNKKRFLVLKHLSLKIKENFETLPYTSQGLLENIERKIDNLPNNFINLLELNQRYEEYIRTSNHDRLKQEIEEEQAEMEEISSEKLREGKQRRISILKKRFDRLQAADERMKITETELETMEDAVRYIYEQSMTMNNPEEVGMQLDNLLMDVDETSTLIDDLDSPYSSDFGIFEKSDDLISGEEFDSDSDSPQQQKARTRS